MGKHTPGQWNVSIGGADEPSEILSAKIVVASVNCDACDKKQREEDIANAHLISAAPELLAACQSILRACGSSANWEGEAHESLKLIEAAIIKATAPNMAT